MLVFSWSRQPIFPHDNILRARCTRCGRRVPLLRCHPGLAGRRIVAWPEGRAHRNRSPLGRTFRSYWDAMNAWLALVPGSRHGLS